MGSGIGGTGVQCGVDVGFIVDNIYVTRTLTGSGDVSVFLGPGDHDVISQPELHHQKT